MTSKKTLLIVTPIFPPAAGGASTYYGTLSKALIQRGQVVGNIVILTEKMPGRPRRESQMGGRLIVHRCFPHRAGKAREGWRQYIKYAYQNLQYLRMGALIKQHGVDLVLVHTGFHNNINLMHLTISALRRCFRCVWIGDVRDHLLPKKRLAELEVYDRLIACSDNVLSHLKLDSSLQEKISKIPVILDHPVPANPERIDALIGPFGLIGKRYIVSIGLVKAQKGAGLLCKAFEILAEVHPDLHLVLVGYPKERKEILAQMTKHSRIHCLGGLDRTDALGVLSRACMSVSLSLSEGMPRNCLEAMAMGKQVALPPDIPEFMRYCPEHVVCEKEPLSVSKRLADILSMGVLPSYPLLHHSIENVLGRYERLFGT